MSFDIPITITVDSTGAVTSINQVTDALGQTRDASVATGAAGSTSMLSMGSAMSHLGVSALVVADRIQIAGDAVQNAHERQTMAQTRLTEAVEKYGRGSDQAIKAQQALDISTRAVEIAQERYNVRMIFAVGAVLPSMAVGIEKVITKLGAMKIATDAETFSMLNFAHAEEEADAASGVGLPIALAAIAIGAGAGLAAGYYMGGGGQGQTQNNVYTNSINVQQTTPASFAQDVTNRVTR